MCKASLVRLISIVIPLFSSLRATEPTATPASEAAAISAHVDSPVAASVVHIFSSLREPNLYQPWLRNAVQESSGSGVVITGHRILTNAHVVNYATQILVVGNDSSEKFTARVVLIAPEVDLAVLALDDDTFFDHRPALPRSRGLPTVQSAVEAFGYPMGGDTLSVTRGIVSRIEYAELTESAKGLRIQIDAAINPGNSGGPVVVNGKMIGLVFSRLTTNAQNIGYLIPNEEIDLFLAHLGSGVYKAKGQMNVVLQDLDNLALRIALNIPGGAQGMRIGKVEKPSPDNLLQPDDVITQVDGVPVDNTGLLRLDDGPRVFMAALIQRYSEKGSVPVTLFRQGEKLQRVVPVTQATPRLVPRLNGAMPEYFVYGPYVFTVATAEFYHDTEHANVPWYLAETESPIIGRRAARQSFPGEQIVCLASDLLPHPTARGLGGSTAAVIESINGQKVRNLRHLVELLRDAKEDFISITYAGGMSSIRDVMNRAQIEAATDEILNENSIRHQASPELLKVWQTGRKLGIAAR